MDRTHEGGRADDVDDASLVKLIRDGDASAWDTLTRRYTGRLWAVARALHLPEADAADAVQTTWLRLVEHVDRLREPEHVGSWLAKTLRHECLRALRRHDRAAPLEAWESIPDDAEPLDGRLLRDERHATLWRALRRLEPRCQTLLRVLMADPPPPYQDVAAALGLPVGSIGPTRKRCLNKLRAFLLPAAQRSARLTDAPTPETA